MDGRPVPILAANVLHMAVFVPPGEHDVEFVYRMPRLAGGMILSLIGAAAITSVAAALFIATRRRRPRPPASGAAATAGSRPAPAAES